MSDQYNTYNNKNSKMKRVIYLEKFSELGMVEAWCGPIGEAHFGEVNLKVISRIDRELPLSGKVVVIVQLEWYRGLARLFFF